jgi:acyl-CoA thioester hydrolase
MSHHFPVRVYYEDTDFGGVVYYANYLKFIERARTELLRAAGIDQVMLKSEGIVFVVRRVEADYLSAAKFDDMLDVVTTVDDIGGARITLTQDVCRGDATVFTAKVTLAAMNDTGRPARLPAALRERLQ